MWQIYSIIKGGLLRELRNKRTGGTQDDSNEHIFG